jgi:hypothetical protein
MMSGIDIVNSYFESSLFVLLFVIVKMRGERK